LSDVEEKVEENTSPSYEILEIHGAIVHVDAAGIVLNKIYDKARKGFIFDFETPLKFIPEPVLSTKKIILKFLISKKLHRKYRRIIYNGNYINVLGQLRTSLLDNENGTLVEKHYLIVLAASEVSAGDKAIKQ
jgi:hypothetical protein